MKKIFFSILCVGLIVGSTNRVEPARHTVINGIWPVAGAILSGAAIGTVGYIAMEIVNKRYPHYADEKKRKLVQRIVTGAAVAVGGGLGWWVLYQWTKGGYYNAAAIKLKAAERNNLMREVEDLGDKEVELDFLKQVYTPGIETYQASVDCKRLRAKLKLAKEYLDAIEEYDDEYKTEKISDKKDELNKLKERLEKVSDFVFKDSKKVKKTMFGDEVVFDKIARQRETALRFEKEKEKLRVLRKAGGQRSNVNIKID